MNHTAAAHTAAMSVATIREAVSSRADRASQGSFLSPSIIGRTSTWRLRST